MLVPLDRFPLSTTAWYLRSVQKVLTMSDSKVTCALPVAMLRAPVNQWVLLKSRDTFM